MPRLVLSKASQAATESVLRQLMPGLDAKLTLFADEVKAMREELRSLDAKVDNLREDMRDGFERQLHVINEVADRVTRLEGKLEGYMEAMRLIVAPPARQSRKRAG